MEQVYAECNQLKLEFLEKEKKKIPNYLWDYADGKRILDGQVLDELMKRAEIYYQKCLDQRSIRVPK